MVRPPQTDQPAYRDPDRPIEDRVNDLVSRMPLEEKVSQFYRLGLPVQVMSDAAIAAGNAKNVNDRTAYFAGICWKKLREIPISGIMARSW